jgi:hypothetical protein
VCVQVLHEKLTRVAHWLAYAGSAIRDDDDDDDDDDQTKQCQHHGSMIKKHNVYRTLSGWQAG